MELADFHFLRPLWLLLVPAGALLPWLWKLRTDPQRNWQKLIAPALLEHLLVGADSARRWRPVHEISIALILGGIAVAGPTWQREPPPFANNKAPMIIAIDLSHSMDATDIAPTRLERAKQKVRDLMALRGGARTGLVVYAGSAHMVVPPAEDAAVMNLFLPALSTDLMPLAGRNSGAALQLADALLQKENEQGGTVLFIADDFDPEQIAAFKAKPETPRQVLMLSVGTRAGGPLRKPDGGIELDASGQPLRAGFDRAHFEKLSAVNVPFASLTLDDADLRWIERRAQRHLHRVQATRADTQWKESGYYLCIPIALLALFWFRRGWVVQWAPLCLTLLAMAPHDAQALELHPLDWFATADQQGRWSFEHGDFPIAAQRFADSQWKGFAFYRAGDYASALGEFARRDDASAYFMMGNCQAHLRNYPNAIAAYNNALKRQPNFPQATKNIELMKKMLAQPPAESEQNPDEPPDDVKFDNKKRTGDTTATAALQRRRESADIWMRNLSTSPAEFLRAKFAIQAGEKTP